MKHHKNNIWFWSTSLVFDPKISNRHVPIGIQKTLKDLIEFKLQAGKSMLCEDTFFRAGQPSSMTRTYAKLPKGNYKSVIDTLKAIEWLS